MKCAMANALWLAGCMSEYRRFHRAVRSVEAEQSAILKRILAANANAEFGRWHGFASIRTVPEYRERVPLRQFDEFREWTERIADGRANVLTREPVRLLEPTSGTGNNGTKLIPYTRGLQREFHGAIRTWIVDLLLSEPKLMGGPAYWSVSPVTMRQRRTRGGIPIGFDDDTSYMGGWQQRLVQSALAVPSAVCEIGDMELFRYVTMLFLVRSRQLRLVSVWNPTFLTLLVEQLPEWGEDLARDLERGTVRGGDGAALPRRVQECLRQDARRAHEIRDALRAKSAAELHCTLWSELRVISCWTDANAAGAAARLGALFPQARVQGKGLIATEGFVSLPMEGREGAALAVRSHFLEFLPLNANGEVDCAKPRLAHELRRGEKYSVVLTTSGGLYRYQLNDLIEVAGHWHECPLVRFAGRHRHISDWYGEKLNEAHVSRALQEVFGELGISPGFAMLACEAKYAAPAYVLYIETVAPDDLLGAAVRGIEARLHENFHYDYARRLGQLGAVRLARVEGAAEMYLAARLRKGQRAGDVKPVSLDGGAGWADVFSREAVL